MRRIKCVITQRTCVDAVQEDPHVRSVQVHAGLVRVERRVVDVVV